MISVGVHTCRVLTCLSLNLSSVYRSTSDVLPTHPSPNRTTLKLCEVVARPAAVGSSIESSILRDYRCRRNVTFGPRANTRSLLSQMGVGLRRNIFQLTVPPTSHGSNYVLGCVYYYLFDYSINRKKKKNVQVIM